MERMEFKLDGRVALLTGAGRGIGLGIAKALAAHGAAVAIQDLDLSVAEAEAEQLRAQGASAMALGGDLTDLEQVAKIAPQVVHRLGGVDILINNGAIQIHRHWQEVTVAEMQRQVNADQLAPIVLSQAVVPHMRAQRWGRIIHIGSIQQRTGNENMPVYAMSKAALVNLTLAMARDLARDQVTVNLLAPGYFNTFRNRKDFPDAQSLIDTGRKIPVGRIGEPRDCAGAALLLASDAGDYITGQTIYIDGGLSAR